MAKKEAKVNNKENNKNKKSFFKGFKAELKKVIWPTPKQLVNNTMAVIVIVLITTLMVFLLDLVFESANKYGVDKLKEVISTESEENQNTASENTDSTENQTTDGENAVSEENQSAESENAESNETQAPETENTATNQN